MNSCIAKTKNMGLPKLDVPGNKEIANCRNHINELNKYKTNNWGIGLNGDSFEPDGFLTFFSQRNLPFYFYVVNKKVQIGTPAAYDANIKTLQNYMSNIKAGESTAAKGIINSLKFYKDNNLAIGLNGNDHQPDHFNPFYAVRELPFKPYVQNGGVDIGTPAAYDENIKTLENYIGQLS